MKLETSIQPRRDGTVIVAIAAGSITFAPGEDGALVADVPDSAVAALIATGNFYPADEANYHRAAQIVQASSDELEQPPLDDDDEDEDDDEQGEEDAGNGGAPVESNTPPKPARKKPGPKPRAAQE